MVIKRLAGFAPKDVYGASIANGLHWKHKFLRRRDDGDVTGPSSFVSCRRPACTRGYVVFPLGLFRTCISTGSPPPWQCLQQAALFSLF